MSRLPNPRFDSPGWRGDWLYCPTEPPYVEVELPDEGWLLLGPDGEPLERTREPFGFQPPKVSDD